MLAQRRRAPGAFRTAPWRGRGSCRPREPVWGWGVASILTAREAQIESARESMGEHTRGGNNETVARKSHLSRVWTKIMCLKQYPAPNRLLFHVFMEQCHSTFKMLSASQRESLFMGSLAQNTGKASNGRGEVHGRGQWGRFPYLRCRSSENFRQA